MNGKAAQMARDAGFLTRDEIAFGGTCSRDDGRVKAFGMDVVFSPIMPEGYFALRNERGAMVCSPSGKTWWVPFYPSPVEMPFNSEEQGG